MTGKSTDSKLRMVHVGLYVLTLIGGLMTCLGLGWATTILSHNCLLYSTMYLTKAPNDSIQIDMIQSRWGTSSVCEYCIYSSTCIISYAIIWFWFYLLLSDWKEKPTVFEDTNMGSPPDARLLIPTLLFNFISWIVCLVSLGFVSLGRVAWCDDVTRSLGKECDYLSQATWSNLENGQYVYNYVLIALIGNWLLFGALSAKIGISTARLYQYLKWDYEQHLKEEEKTQLQPSEKFDAHCSLDRDAPVGGKPLHKPKTADKGPLFAGDSSEEDFSNKQETKASTSQTANYPAQVVNDSDNDADDASDNDDNNDDNDDDNDDDDHNNDDDDSDDDNDDDETENLLPPISTLKLANVINTNPTV